jgi:cytochrome b6
MSSFFNSKIGTWLDQRLNLEPVKNLILHKKVPVHKHTIWYYLGGVTLFLFFIQVFTGILLLMYYQPTEDTAYESMQYILTKVHFGWLIRNIHSWSANLMIFFALAHMFSVFFTRAYVKPRELTWASGMVLLVLAMAFGFSGYLLPWNELSFFATKVGTDIVSAVPFIGNDLKILLRGGEEVSGATLSRFFGLHVAILPALFTMLLSLHLLLVQQQGMSEPAHFKSLPENKKRYIPFFPDFIMRDMLLWLLINLVILSLAVFYPWDLGLKADPLASAPTGIKPEWYFMFIFQTLKFIPPHILIVEGETFGILFFGSAGILWILFPFIRIKNKYLYQYRFAPVLGILTMLFSIVMTILGYLL